MPKQIVVWAIDPAEREANPDPAVVGKLMSWARMTAQEIQPVHVVPAPQELNEPFVKAGEASRYLASLGATETRAPRTLTVEGASRTEEVCALIRLAEEQNASCIAVSSHGRSGMQRLLLGSFAENLLLHSPLPVLFLSSKNPLNSSAKAARKITRAVFYTDFSENSLAAFTAFLPQARDAGVEIILLNCVFLPVTALGAGEPVMIPDDFFASQLQCAKEDCDHWVGMADAEHVSAKFVVRDEGIGANIARSVLSVVHEQKADLIVLASVSGPVKSLVLGSIVRDIFHANLCPAWIYGPKALELAHEHRSAASSQNPLKIRRSV